MLARLLCDDACGHLHEGIRRISTCLDMIGEADLWRDHNPELVSIGNLMLHLNGNVSQYILRGLGGRDYLRVRDREFTVKPQQSRRELLADLSATVAEACRVIKALTKAQLERDYAIQGFTLSGAGVVMHVVEHFSYHVGQITFATKLITGKSTGYYAGRDLTQQ